MKITKISILNFLGIAAFKTNRLGKLNRITGGNGVGKSAIVKAIKEAYKSSGRDPHLIKIGEEKAEILIEMDHKIIIERKITQSTNQVKVVADSQPMNSPQKYLDALIGPFNFDPVNFFLAKPKERRRILLSSIDFNLDQAALNEALGDLAVPIDLSKFDYSRHGLEILKQIQDTVYERRHEQNIDLTRLTKSLEQDRQDIPETFDGEKFADFDIQAKTNEFGEAKVACNGHGRDKSKLEDMRARVSQINSEIKQHQSEIARLEEERRNTQADGKVLANRVEAFVKPDIEEMQAAIDEYNASQELVQKVNAIKGKEADIETATEQHHALDGLHKALTTTVPRMMLAQVDLPVDNLEIKGDQILVNGCGIDKLSTSEQIQFAVNVARSVSAKVKVICVDRFESLDKNARKAFEEATVGDGFQYIVVVVTEGDLAMETITPTVDKAKKAGKPAATAKGAQMDVGF